jgi:filamentous hemagglutinin
VSWWCRLAALFLVVGAVVCPLRASAATGMQLETRVRGIELVVHALVGGSSARSPEKHLGSSPAYDEIAPGYSLAAEGAGAVISEGKFGYLFGEASGNAHNVERALENASQLSRVGVYNNAEGQALLQAHFDGVVGDSSNIISSTSNQYGNFVTRQSLFAGPGGFISFQSTWQVLEGGAQRFITAIPFGGP